MLRTLVFPLLAAMAVMACAPQAPEEDLFSASGEVIAFGGGDAGPAAACMRCHGLSGEGDGGATPRLAGLDPGYLHRQLDDYANGRREHALMRAIVRRLDGEARARVSAYYAGLDFQGTEREDSENPEGAALYLHGDPARGLRPCAQCHGVAGEGVGPGNPPLGRQPAAYLAGQLDAWRTGRRHNDPLGEMREISRRLSAVEIRPVARYAAGLPGLRPPAVRAASRAAHRDDPRNDASAQRRHGSGS